MELDLMKRAHALLRRFYGYDTFRPGQAEIIEGVCRGRDALVLMPTGGGKSLCYQLPALLLPGCAVVVSPLIALMHDQTQALVANGIPAAAVNSNCSEEHNRRVMEGVIAGKIKLLYISPERLMADIPRWGGHVPVSFFAVDEAHCISQWGHDFRPVYTGLSRLKETFPDKPVVALTATADRLTRDDIAQSLRLRDPLCFTSSFDRPNISLQVVRDPGSARRIKVIENLIRTHPYDSGIVYCISRAKTEKMYQMLLNRGYKAVCYHAGMPAKAREEAQRRFINGDAQVVCATIAFGMGIDKSNIRWVVHNNIPANIESYYQEVGRAGRDGLPATAVMFYSVADVITRRKLIMDTEGELQGVKLEKLNRMVDFAEATVCRRRMLLSYFGEEMQHDCHNCDVCNNPPERIDGTVLVQKALSAVVRTGGRVGVYMLNDILRGVPSNDILSLGFNKIKTFGVGRDLKQREWAVYITQMIQLGLLEVAFERGNHLRVTPYGRKVLAGEVVVQLSKFKEEKAKAATRGRKAAAQKPETFLDYLKKVRKKVADEAGMPAYMVFSDATLMDMARRHPRSMAEFSRVSGVGEFKARRFGPAFVEAILEYPS